MGAVVEVAERFQVLFWSPLCLPLAARLDFDVVRADLAGNLLLLVVAVLVARPLAVAVSTIRSGLSWRERLFLACVAPRGIVAAAIASVFAGPACATHALVVCSATLTDSCVHIAASGEL